MSAPQIFRMLEFGSYRTTWFMAHRIREAMNGDDANPPMGEAGRAMEVVETFTGHLKDKLKAKGGAGHKMKVVSLVDRDTRRSRSIVVDDLSPKTIVPILEANMSREAHLMTDETSRYGSIGWNYSVRGVVNCGKDEYVRYEAGIVISTNCIEGYFSIFKRGIYQHCGEQHLHRYMNEFDFRYSNRWALGITDDMRAVIVVKGAVGKRLTYRQPDGLKAA